jgi:hypothetical protein
MKNTPNIVHLSDVLELFKMADYTGNVMEKRITLSYSQSKMTIIDEMENFDKYTHLKKVEFYELIGRFAELVVKN